MSTSVRSLTRRTLPLLLLTTAVSAASARASMISFASPGGAVTGDPALAPLVAPAGEHFSGATITQTGAQFTVTNLTVHDGSAGFVIRDVAGLGFAATGASLTIDGILSAANPGNVWIYATMWAGSAAPNNPYGYLVYDLGVSLTGLSNGTFSRTWTQDPRFAGPVAAFYLGVTITGLAPGDTLTFPSSVGLDLSVPASSVPEPATLLLMGTALLAALGRARVRR